MKKVLKIVLVALLVCLAITSFILYSIFPSEFKEFIANFWDILNRPLPIVGVTSVAILFFLWKVFVTINYGKKRINEYKNENALIKEEWQREKEANRLELEKQKEEIIKERKENKKEISYLRGQLISVCNTSPNLKVKKLGQKIEKESKEYGEGKETINC